MNTIKLLHLGDVHYDQARLERAVDHKDRAMPVKLLESATVSPLQAVFRKLSHTEVDGIAMVGDLTTGGNLEVYAECADYLTESLDLRSRDPRLVHVVPGNHDVDHELTGQDDLLAKFVPLEEVWTNLGLPVLSANGPRQGTVQQGSGGVEIFGLNSAVGTGEHEAEKAQIPDAVAEAMREARLEAAAEEDFFGVNIELLDTPSFIESDIARTCEEIEKLPIETVPVLVSHHNLMPQALTRAAPYAHVLNGGMARDRLTSCGRPIVYLHGHIHERPIEVVRQYAPNQGELICISAPLVMRGFNLLELVFTSGGLPLGCLVRQFGVSSNGNVEEIQAARIPFVTGPKAADPLVKHIVSALAEKSPYRFEDLREHLEAVDLCPGDEEALADALREAEWHGLVNIGERNYSPTHWRISGELP
jgi:hypothetical protein